jgi:acetyl esterase/lipase
MPLVVSLHAWSFGFEQEDPVARHVLQEGWSYIRPNFRGPNTNPDACLSRKALSDIDDAIAYAKAHAPVDERFVFVAGVSGGGLATLGTYMRARPTCAFSRVGAISIWSRGTTNRFSVKQIRQGNLGVTSSKDA